MMDDFQSTEILILGGGIAGLTAALALKKRGFDTVVAEAAAESRPVGAGITLAPNAMKAYRSLGIEEDITAAGRRIETFQILDRRGRVISQTKTNLIGDGTPSIAIHRGDLHQVLLNHLDRSEDRYHRPEADPELCPR